MSGLGESNVHAGRPRFASKAFTMIEIMIALAVLGTLAAVALPTLITRGLDNTRTDTEARLHAALLDARREAQRTGQTTEIVWTQAPGRRGQTVVLIVVQPLRPDRVESAAVTDWPADEMAVPPPSDDTASSESNQGLETSETPQRETDDSQDMQATIGYVLPDGTFVPSDASYRFELDGRLYSLDFEALAAQARFEPLAEDTDSEAGP